ncbi:hypothetical protein AAEP93_005702 [Penicillium crustosum]
MCRACGGSIGWRLGWRVGIEPIKWNVSVCEHVEGSGTCGGFILFSFKRFGDVSVCERAEGNRACGGSIGWRRGWLVGVTAENRTDQTSLSVNMRKAAGRVWWIDPFLLQGRGLGTSLSVNARKAAERVVAQLECWLVGTVATNRTDRTERLCL